MTAASRFRSSRYRAAATAAIARASASFTWAACARSSAPVGRRLRKVVDVEDLAKLSATAARLRRAAAVASLSPGWMTRRSGSTCQVDASATSRSALASARSSRSTSTSLPTG